MSITETCQPVFPPLEQGITVFHAPLGDVDAL